MDEAIRTRDELSVALSGTARATAELNASLASAPVGFAFHDLQGRYRRVNDCLATLDGITVEKHIGRLPSEVVPAFGRLMDDHVGRTINTGHGVFNVELVANAAERAADVRYWLASFYPIRTIQGELLGVGSVVMDLTAHKQLEMQLLQSQKMEAVGRLAAAWRTTSTTSSPRSPASASSRSLSSARTPKRHGASSEIRDGGRPRRRADPPAAGVQPPTGAAAARARPERRRERGRPHAAATDRRGHRARVELRRPARAR